MADAAEIKTLEEIRRTEDEVEWLLSAARTEASAIIEAARKEAASVSFRRGQDLDEAKNAIQTAAEAGLQKRLEEIRQAAGREAERLESLAKERVDEWASELMLHILPELKEKHDAPDGQ